MDQKEIATSHIKYKDKDARGVYRSVEVVGEGKTYTREEWNKMIEHLDPHKKQKESQKIEELLRESKSHIPIS